MCLELLIYPLILCFSQRNLLRWLEKTMNRGCISIFWCKFCWQLPFLDDAVLLATRIRILVTARWYIYASRPHIRGCCLRSLCCSPSNLKNFYIFVQRWESLSILVSVVKIIACSLLRLWSINVSLRLSWSLWCECSLIALLALTCVALFCR